MNGAPARLLAAIALACALATSASCGPAPGSPCAGDDACGEGLVCARARVDGGLAPEGVCAPPLLGAGAVCAVTAECASGLFCSNDLPGAAGRYGACVPAQPEGAPCYRSEDCAAGLACEKGDAGVGACAPG